MASKISIRDLQDLANRVSKNLPLENHIREEAINQLNFLKQKTKPLTSSQIIATSRDDLDCFRELETMVQIAEQNDIPGFNEVKVEFYGLLMQYRSAGRPLYQRTQNFTVTLPAKSSKPKAPILDNENEMREKILTLRGHKPKSRPALNEDVFSHETSPRNVPYDEYMRLKKSEESLKTQVEELTTRLSRFASEKLVDQNPHIADLSDQNRPTKLGERFGELYDNEWSDAFEELKDSGIKLKDDEILSVLMTIVKLIHWMCPEVAGQQLERLERAMERPLTEIKWKVRGPSEDYNVHRQPEDPAVLSKVARTAKELRKSSALASVPSLCVLFKDSVFRAEFTSIDYNKHPNLEKYIDECVKCIWLMCVHDPPMCLVFQKKEEQIDLEQFRFYDRKGKLVEQCVWPAVLLFHDGPLISKGYVLPKA